MPAADNVAVVAAVVVVNTKRLSHFAEKKTMIPKHSMQGLSLLLLLAMAPVVDAAPPATPLQHTQQRHFATPEAAASALAEAVRSQDRNALLAVLGPTAGNWLFSGDPVADRADWQRFLAAYDKKNSLSQTSAGQRTFLLIGEAAWPFPAPLVRQGETWVFDAAAGREEILNRRIGRNELDTIQTLLAIVDAQREYAATDPDGNGLPDYARCLRSSPGQKDGLFWPTAAGETLSPLGPLVGAASAQGYGKKAGTGQTPAYHGYRYRLLTAQCQDAPGGAYNYLVDGKLLGGFAVVAYPAHYGTSGVMTFIVNHDAAVYEKNLGKNTLAEASKMPCFNPGSGWKKPQ